jgi:hypothetical protein
MGAARKNCGLLGQSFFDVGEVCDRMKKNSSGGES